MNFKNGFKIFTKSTGELCSLLENSLESIRKNSDSLRRNDQYKIYELCYLKLFIAFEEFTECTFVSYLLGKKTPLGYSPKLICKAKNEVQALDIISGKVLKKSEYIEWGNLNSLARKAEVLFNGLNPYQNLLERSDYRTFKDLRNSIAHTLSFHKNPVKDIQERFSLLPYDPSAKTPGELLAKRIKIKEEERFFFYFLKDEIIKSAEILMTDPR